MKLAPNFTFEELSCPCCRRLPFETGALTKEEWDIWLSILQHLRDAYKRPMNVTSGYRCPKHNAKIGGAPSSQHMRMAVDIAVWHSDLLDLLHIAHSHGWTGFGISSRGRFLHLDRRPTNEPVLFTYPL